MGSVDDGLRRRRRRWREELRQWLRSVALNPQIVFCGGFTQKSTDLLEKSEKRVLVHSLVLSCIV
ncbi:hypothetical protein ACS0TY_018984 [Phlomoides rotata]